MAGIGRGESIYAVRFVGDVGYIVTFRTTDPLFTVDLATPDRPKVVGELKLRRYSAYLHPIDDGLLIGIGQDADESGQETGSQISLFDVSDPSEPVRLDQRTIAPDSYSNVEFDHHAFLYWPERALTVGGGDWVPFQRD